MRANGVTLMLLLGGILFRKRAWLIAGTVLLWVSSLPLVGGWLIRATEQWAVRIPVQDARVADAIVVLSCGPHRGSRSSRSE
jgi:hypothetical protein